ncbi:MAG: helix-turn-helix domain-containing protein [Pseudolysinimonas sp.]
MIQSRRRDLEAQSQTLARGLTVLDVLAEAGRPLTIAEVCETMSVHRSIGYRLVRTLEAAGLVVRDASGALLLGPHLVTLAGSVASGLQAGARPVLQGLADTLGMTSFLVVLDQTECVTLVTVEPRGVVASIAQRPGSRHSVLRGAPGIAMQSLLTLSDRTAMGLDGSESQEVLDARRSGFARSVGEVIPGVTAVAAPVGGAVRAAVAVLYVSYADDETIVEAVRAAAAQLSGSNR